MDTSENIQIRRLNKEDLDLLADYLADLSAETQQRFTPHSFDKVDLMEFYTHSEVNIGYIALNDGKIIAYSVIKTGYLPKDFIRFQNYGLLLKENQTCTFAPSVADDWQGKGLGEKVFQFICQDLAKSTFRQIILWGGVQSNNQKALRYYQKLGFQTVGCFDRNGKANQDMVLNL